MAFFDACALICLIEGKELFVGGGMTIKGLVWPFWRGSKFWLDFNL